MPKPRKAVLADFRRRWRVALADAGLSETAWAKIRGRTATHVRLVATGERHSDQLLAEMEAFVQSRERLIARRLAAAAARARPESAAELAPQSTAA